MGNPISKTESKAKVRQWMILILMTAFVLYYVGMRIYNANAKRDSVEKTSGG